MLARCTKKGCLPGNFGELLRTVTVVDGLAAGLAINYKMSHPGAWGGQIEAQALKELCQVNSAP